MTRSRRHDDAPLLALAGARIERLMSVVRWAASGLVFGIGPFIPNIGFDQVVALGAGLFVLSALPSHAPTAGVGTVRGWSASSLARSDQRLRKVRIISEPRT